MPTHHAVALSLVTAACCLSACDPAEVEPDAGGAQDAGEPTDGGAAIDAGADAGGPRCAPVDPDVVQFTTDDSISIEGDLYLSGETGGASVVLIHMIPPSNDRGNFPRPFIDALVSRCITVLNIDRRGAGASGGEPTDAYEGPGGALDAKGAVEYLLAHTSAPDPFRTGVVGASNGTTAALDFTVFTEQARTVELPAAVVMLSAGGYTENQNSISGSELDAVPTLFAYPEAERAYNEALMADAPSGWLFQAYSPGAHGTQLFGASPDSIDDVADFLGARLVP